MLSSSCASVNVGVNYRAPSAKPENGLTRSDSRPKSLSVPGCSVYSTVRICAAISLSTVSEVGNRFATRRGNLAGRSPGVRNTGPLPITRRHTRQTNQRRAADTADRRSVATIVAGLLCSPLPETKLALIDVNRPGAVQYSNPMTFAASWWTSMFCASCASACHGRTLGIVGLGGAGRHVARYGMAFGIVYADRKFSHK